MPEWYNVTLKAKKAIAADTAAFVLEKPAGFSYQAGQFLGVWLDIDPYHMRDNVRSMSLASAPCEPDLMIAMRMTDSKFKTVLNELPLESTLRIQGPFGRLVLDENDTRPLVFLAGGIGIVPFRSMMLQEQCEGFPREITLLYSNRTVEDISFKHELDALQHDQLRIISTLTDQPKLPLDWQGEQGRIDKTMIQKYIPDIMRPLYYIVGTPSFVQSLFGSLTSMGVAKEQIFQELFTGYPSLV